MRDDSDCSPVLQRMEHGENEPREMSPSAHTFVVTHNMAQGEGSQHQGGPVHTRSLLHTTRHREKGANIKVRSEERRVGKECLE